MFIAMVGLEGNRGIVLAAIDFLCLLLGMIGTQAGYVPLADHMKPSMAYLTIAVGVLLITAFLSIFVSRRLEIRVTALEAAIGALFGMLSALVLTYGLFHWLEIRYGAAAPIIRDSIVGWVVLDFAGIEALADFLHTLMG
jgi:hypothetical protein